MILPRAPKPVVSLDKTTPKKDVASVVAPIKTVRLSRQQVLQQELRREKEGLYQARAQWQVAKNKHDTASMQRLQAHITDRELNIHALEQEWRR